MDRSAKKNSSSTKSKALTKKSPATHDVVTVSKVGPPTRGCVEQAAAVQGRMKPLSELRKQLRWK